VGCPSAPIFREPSAPVVVGRAGQDGRLRSRRHVLDGLGDTMVTWGGSGMDLMSYGQITCAPRIREVDAIAPSRGSNRESEPAAPQLPWTWRLLDLDAAVHRRFSQHSTKDGCRRGPQIARDRVLPSELSRIGGYS